MQGRKVKKYHYSRKDKGDGFRPCRIFDLTIVRERIFSWVNFIHPAYNHPQ